MFDCYQRRLIWWWAVKGGLGKDHGLGVLAVLAASRGKRCLVVSTDPAQQPGLMCRPGKLRNELPKRCAAQSGAMEIDTGTLR